MRVLIVGNIEHTVDRLVKAKMTGALPGGAIHGLFDDIPDVHAPSAPKAARVKGVKTYHVGNPTISLFDDSDHPHAQAPSFNPETGKTIKPGQFAPNPSDAASPAKKEMIMLPMAGDHPPVGFVPDFNKYDWIVINSSGGKDSQSMLDYVAGLTKGHEDKVVVVHADLGRVEWEGTKELAEKQAQHYGFRFEVVKRGQDLLDHIAQRREDLDARGLHNTPAWPSSTTRFCTSDHKRGQVDTLYTRLVQESLADGHKGKVKILNCMGFRKDESPARAKRLPFDPGEAVRNNKSGQPVLGRGTNGKRAIDQWLPIHDWNVKHVWDRIKRSGVDHHHAYDLGMPRLSCAFCIFAPKAALLLAGKHNPKLLQTYVDLERKVRHTFRVDTSLADIQKQLKDGYEPQPIQDWNM